MRLKTMEMKHSRILKNTAVLSALIGMVGAVGNNGRTGETDAALLHALSEGIAIDRPEEAEREAEKIRAVKFRLSPGCRSCASPCGSTSDMDMKEFDGATPELREQREKLLGQMQALAWETEGMDPENARREENIVFLYQAAAAIGYDTDGSFLTELIDSYFKSV